MPARDDFPRAVKELLAKRVGFRCSNPTCKQPTSGPDSGGSGGVNIGVAAHITAAAPGGPRYDEGLSPEQRVSGENGIWLCENCAKLVDSDLSGHSVAELKEWKHIAEAIAYLELRGFKAVPVQNIWSKIESDMPDLIAEMRADLKEHPLHREFFLLHRKLIYNIPDFHIAYTYEEHPDLRHKIRILENYGVVMDITVTSIERFQISEEFADYLKAG